MYHDARSHKPQTVYSAFLSLNVNISRCYICGPRTFSRRGANNVYRPKESPCPVTYKWSQPKRQRCRAQL